MRNDLIEPGISRGIQFEAFGPGPLRADLE